MRSSLKGCDRAPASDASVSSRERGNSHLARRVAQTKPLRHQACMSRFRARAVMGDHFRSGRWAPRFSGSAGQRLALDISRQKTAANYRLRRWVSHPPFDPGTRPTSARVHGRWRPPPPFSVRVGDQHRHLPENGSQIRFEIVLTRSAWRVSLSFDEQDSDQRRPRSWHGNRRGGENRSRSFSDAVKATLRPASGARTSIGAAQLERGGGLRGSHR